ncbi:ATP-grasp domain-containing protein [Desulfatitalea alkaliphila]|uniref:Prokaryotic glutathione synthetase ATP-binding domain-containing protein n=1 Tax=Desulfatitalea alkaliphila TaxID=2929485 RepID=A0AA41ULM2_9BACT|nr:hypothetical protein [Desulfatitalea alkaliphila]MCJ8501676.1 hypothetical protein [Desulfatitalea alkaliphila]
MRIDGYTQLMEAYHQLAPGDLFVGQIPASPLKAVLLTDLACRGVRLLPSAVAQTLHGNKCAQAFLLAPWMVPHTRVMTRRKALLDLLGEFERRGIAAAVTKHDHLHCGHGVRKWDDLEMLYNCMSLDEGRFPFVVQPYCEVTVDVRVVLVGEYVEAYARCNPQGFRKNLAAGGHSRHHVLTADQEEMCRRVMDRAQMPYAHMDLMVLGDGTVYLSEISLYGGVRGARVTQAELERMKRSRLAELAGSIYVDEG